MSNKFTNIIAHFSIPGLIIALFSKKRKDCKFYINQNIVLNLLGAMIFLISLIPFEFIDYVEGGLLALLGIAWLYSFLGAIWEVKHHIPGISAIKFF